MAVMPPTRIEGCLGRKGPTHDEASNTQQMESPQREKCTVPSRVRQEPAQQGYGATSRGYVCDPHEAEAVTGRVQRAASPLVNAIDLRAPEFNAYWG